MRAKIPMLLIRFVVGLVFVTEGILKYVRPEELGAGRFAQIGFPFSHLLAPFVGGVEIAAGVAVLLGVLAGEGALLLLAVMVTALISTKIPILTGQPLWIFHVPRNVAHTGVLGFMHEARLDVAMLFSLIAILIDSGMRLGRKKRWNHR
jgi:uncharacterized membrane protein YphA (DoxX/SURF4 family)